MSHDDYCQLRHNPDLPESVCSCAFIAEVRADEREKVIHRLIHGDNTVSMGFYTDEPSENGWIDGQISELCDFIRSAAARGDGSHE